MPVDQIITPLHIEPTPRPGVNQTQGVLGTQAPPRESSSPDTVFDSARKSEMQAYRHAIQVGTDTANEVPAAVNMKHFDNIVASWNALHPDVPCVSIPNGEVGPHIADFKDSADDNSMRFALVGFESKRLELTKGQPTRHKQLLIMDKQDGKSAFLVIDSGITRNLEKGHYFFEQAIKENPDCHFAYCVSHVQQSYVGCSNYLEFFMRTLTSPKKCKPMLEDLLMQLRSGHSSEMYAQREQAFRAADLSDYGKMRLSRDVFFKFKDGVSEIPNLQVMDARLIFPARMFKYTTYLHVNHDKKFDAHDFIRLRELLGDKYFAKEPVNATGQTLTEYMKTHMIPKSLVWDEELIWNGPVITERQPIYSEQKINGALEHGIVRTLKKQFDQLGIAPLHFEPSSDYKLDPRAMTSAEFKMHYPAYTHYSQVPNAWQTFDQSDPS